ncbi:MAG: DUF2332 domain-containing protein [Acidimicrobiales bacterium]|nr:DUF2332 domain-containing protein [Acidimicrobiales bacterium]
MSADRPRDMAMVDVVRLQERACDRAGSHLYARILDSIADDVERGGPAGRLLAPWAENALADAIPLRLLAAVHRIVLDGRAPDLARFYPSAGGSDDGDPSAAFAAVLADRREEIEAGMHRGVQTNEVGRAAALVGGFHAAAASSGLPLRVLEVGASAGLLQHWDRYRYVGAGRAWGPSGGLTFEEPWSGSAPQFVDDLHVAERAGCDVHPIDVSTDDGVTALRGFLWPDQVHRRQRLDAAIEVAREHPASVDEADAGAWVEERLAAATPGLATVLYHSIVLQYLPRSSFDRMRSALQRAGERATAETPLFWLRMEPAGVVADLQLQSWPGGEDRVLGTTGFHGPPVDWTATR